MTSKRCWPDTSHWRYNLIRHLQNCLMGHDMYRGNSYQRAEHTVLVQKLCRLRQHWQYIKLDSKTADDVTAVYNCMSLAVILQSLQWLATSFSMLPAGTCTQMWHNGKAHVLQIVNSRPT